MRDFIRYLVEEKQLRPATCNIYIAAFKFLFVHTLGRGEQVRDIGGVRGSARLPQVLSVEEVRQILDAIKDATLRALVAMMYGAGLRVGEAWATSTAHGCKSTCVTAKAATSAMSHSAPSCSKGCAPTGAPCDPPEPFCSRAAAATGA